MKVDTYKLKVTLITPLLGTQATREVAMEFIAARSGVTVQDDELDTLPDKLDRMTTVFHKDKDGNPLLFDYQCKGQLKQAAKVLNGKEGLPKAFRSKVENLVFISPRMIRLHAPNGDEDCRSLLDTLERPLRAETAQGPRIALARSEMLPEGVWFECGITVFPGEITEEVLRELLDYGYWQGLLQWRSGGFGRLTYTLAKEDDE